MTTLEEFHRYNVEQAEEDLREHGGISPEVKLLTKEPGVTLFMWEHWKDSGISPLALPDLAMEKFNDWEVMSFRCILMAPGHELKNYRHWNVVEDARRRQEEGALLVATMSKDGRHVTTMKSIKGEGKDMVAYGRPGDVPWPFDDARFLSQGTEPANLGTIEMTRLTLREWSLRSAIRACVYVGPESAPLLRKLLLLHNRVSKKQLLTRRRAVRLRRHILSVVDLRLLKEGLESIPQERRLPSDRRLLYNVDLRLGAIEAGEDLGRGPEGQEEEEVG